MPVKKCCIITESSSQNAWTAVVKWEVIITGWDGLCGCFGKKILNHHIFIISYLPFVERMHLHAAVFNWAWSFNSDKEPAQKGISHGHLATLHTSAKVQYPH